MTSDRDRRICEAAICALDGSPSKRLNIVVLNKALFYADLVALRDLGETITGSEYLALPMGPTIKGYDKHLVRALQRLGWAEQEEIGQAKPMHKVATPDEFKFLSTEERSIVRAMGQRSEAISSAKWSDFSHDNVAWKVARELGETEFNGRGMPINMMLALQQLDDDPWLDEPMSAAELAEIADAVRSGGSVHWE